jgi:hypothetical protein
VLILLHEACSFQGITQSNQSKTDPRLLGAHYPEAHYPEAHYPEAHYPEAHYPEAHYPEGRKISSPQTQADQGPRDATEVAVSGI